MARPPNPKMPRVEKTHYILYAQWIGKFGTAQSGVRMANTLMLEELELEDTRDNRQWVSGKFKPANPNNERCKQEYRDIFEAFRNRPRQDVADEIEKDTNKNHQILENLKNLLLSTVGPEFFEGVDNADIINFIIKITEAQGKGNELKSKLFGLLTDRKQVEISATSEADAATGNISDLPELSTVGETEGSTESD